MLACVSALSSRGKAERPRAQAGPVGHRAGVVLAAAVVTACLAHPAAAGAHLRSGTVAVDYRATIARAQTAAYSARIFQSDRALQLTIRPGHVVVLVGYLGEPVFRIDGSGLWVNDASATAVVLKLVKRSDRVVSAAPRWRLQRGRRSVIWQDARAQGLAPGATRGSWSVPLIVDGRQARLVGELQRFPAPALWPWLAMLIVVLVASAALAAGQRRESLARAAVGLGVAAAVAATAVLVAFALDAYASPGTWIVGVDAIVFIGVGAWILRRAPKRWRVAPAIGLGLLATAVGLLEGAIFVHPIVLAVLPGDLTRFIDIVAIGAGLAAAGLGGFYYLESAEQAPDGGPRLSRAA